MMNQHTNVTESSDYVTSYSEFETINDDCLWIIVNYLNILDVVNLAATCSRFHNFAEDVIYPKKARKIFIIDCQIDTLTASLLTASDAKLMRKIKIKRIETAVSCFGEFVNDLRFNLSSCHRKNHKIWRSCVMMMEHCQNLTTLSIQHVILKRRDIRELQRLIENYQNLKELVLFECSGLTNNWSTTPLNRNSKVDKLSMTAANKISSNFFEYFSDLSSLTVRFTSNCWKTSDIVNIFSNNSHSLKHLNLMNLFVLDGYECVGRIIDEKLQKLERLELDINITDKTWYMIEMNNLKSLKVGFADNTRINAVLRLLSDTGIIEKLHIHEGVFEDEDESASPKIFNELKSLKLIHPGNMSSFFKTIHKSQMKNIQVFSLEWMEPTQILVNGLLKFIESKRTLNSLTLIFHGELRFVLIEFFRQLINMLKEPCMPKRPFLYVDFWSEFRLKDEEVCRITCLLKFKCFSTKIFSYYYRLDC